MSDGRRFVATRLDFSALMARCPGCGAWTSLLVRGASAGWRVDSLRCGLCGAGFFADAEAHRRFGSLVAVAGAEAAAAFFEDPDNAL